MKITKPKIQKDQTKGEHIMSDETYKVTREADLITVQLLEYFGAVEYHTFRPDQLILCAESGNTPYLVPAGKASDAEFLSHILKRGFVA